MLALASFLGMSPKGWSALGQMLLGGGAVIGGAWAIFNYRRSRRDATALWLQGVFKDFYLSNTFSEVRQLLEYHYPERVEPLLERRLADPHSPVSGTEIEILQSIDTLLNYFEYILYLENERHLSRSDRQPVFEYWFEFRSAGADPRRVKMMEDPTRVVCRTPVSLWCL